MDYFSSVTNVTCIQQVMVCLFAINQQTRQCLTISGVRSMHLSCQTSQFIFVQEDKIMIRLRIYLLYVPLFSNWIAYWCALLKLDRSFVRLVNDDIRHTDVSSQCCFFFYNNWYNYQLNNYRWWLFWFRSTNMRYYF